MNSIRILVSESVDYAGLFPPASLDMRAAAAKYAGYVEGPHSWMLGRFVVPAPALESLEQSALSRARESGACRRWRVGALIGADLAGDLRAVHAFNARSGSPREGWSAVVDTVELKADSPDALRQAVRATGGGFAVYVEVPGGRAAELALAAREAGARMKVRTGGVTPEMFPCAGDLARFIHACASAGVPFKATAGLHHPLRCVRPLTYDEGSPSGLMHGFLNVFLAAAFALQGGDEAATRELLEERDPGAFRFEEQGIGWRAQYAHREQIASARKDLAASFGSCSFEEPVRELQDLGLL